MTKENNKDEKSSHEYQNNSTSMSPKTPEERANMDMIPYASAIGSIMYAMLCTRPDIAHALSVTSRY